MIKNIRKYFLANQRRICSINRSIFREPITAISQHVRTSFQCFSRFVWAVCVIVIEIKEKENEEIGLRFFFSMRKQKRRSGRKKELTELVCEKIWFWSDIKLNYSGHLGCCRQYLLPLLLSLSVYKFVRIRF